MGKEFQFGKTKLSFSPAVWHGASGTKIGYVIMLSVTNGKEKFVFGSDAQGPIDDDAAEWIIKQNPNLAIIDGSISYMLGFKLSWKDFTHGVENLARIFQEAKNLKKVICGHHMLRDLNYKKKLSKNKIIEGKIKNKKLVTAAEFLGKKVEMLEAHRRELYREYPVEKNI